MSRSILKEAPPLTKSDCFSVFARYKTEFDFPVHYHEEYELNFVSYKKFPLRLVKSERAPGYEVYATVNQKKVILKRLYVHIEGGTFWAPNVKYIQVEGVNVSTGENMVERILV